MIKELRAYRGATMIFKTDYSVCVVYNKKLGQYVIDYLPITKEIIYGRIDEAAHMPILAAAIIASFDSDLTYQRA